jgi:ABC-type glycerol-3-phosphate transport system substrate-binding protein
MKNIQITISVIFGIFILVGVFVFAGIIPSPKTAKQQQTSGKVTIWGTVDHNLMNELIQQQILSKYSDLSVKYSEHPANTFATDLIEALASGTGPDLVLLPNDLIVRFSGKIEPFTPVMYPERTFRDTFIEEGELFISPKLGILALPFTVDPMVMYWNRNMFSAGNITRPPEYWDEFLTLSPILSKRSDANDILKSAVAFGEFRNVTHAKDILSLLIIQTGNPISVLGDGISPTLDGISARNIPPADEAIRFYTDFADSEKPIYSWNRSLPESKNAFLSQDLAIYFGYSSELFDIQTKNPNLNFDTSRVPQVRDLPFKSTYGKMLGVAVMKTSTNKSGAFFTAGLLTTPEFNIGVSKVLHLPLAQRVLLAKVPSDPFMKVFYDSALISKSWLDMNPEKTYTIFQTIIDSVIAGKVRIHDAVDRAQAELLLIR